MLAQSLAISDCGQSEEMDILSAIKAMIRRDCRYRRSLDIVCVRVGRQSANLRRCNKKADGFNTVAVASPREL